MWGLTIKNLTTNEHINWAKYGWVDKVSSDRVGMEYEYRSMFDKGVWQNFLALINLRVENYDPFDPEYLDWKSDRHTLVSNQEED